MSDEIDALIGDIEKSQVDLENIVEKEKAVIIPEDKASMPVIANEIFNKVNANDKVAEEIYRLFYDNLAIGRDKSDASKDALLRSLEARIESSKILAELAKAVARRDGNKGNVGVGIAISTNPGELYGIDVEKINDELGE
jgi:predicted NBD/HSP70 family sugar kinase